MALKLKKPTTRPNGAKAAPLAAGKKAAAAEKPAAAAKPKADPKPINDGEIVIFKNYKTKQTNPMFTEGEELAVVGTLEKEGVPMIAVVKSSMYHKYKEDPDNTDGEQLLFDEVRRTNKTVPAPYHLPVVGDMANLLKQYDNDALAAAQELYSRASEAFFYFGGVLAKLWKETDEDTNKPLFCSYEDEKGRKFENSKEGFEAFVTASFGQDMSYRKAAYYMSIYENFSVLPNAAQIIRELPKVKWFKAGMLAQYVTDSNATELVKIGQEQSVTELRETLKKDYTTEGNTARGAPASRATIKRISMQFKLYEDQAEAVELILKTAARQTGIQDSSQLFEHIVSEWATDHLEGVAEKAKAASEKKRKTLLKSGAKLPSDHPMATHAEAA